MAHVELKLDIPSEELAAALARLSDSDIEWVLRLFVTDWVLKTRRRPKGRFEKERRKRLEALCEHVQAWLEE